MPKHDVSLIEKHLDLKFHSSPPPPVVKRKPSEEELGYCYRCSRTVYKFTGWKLIPANNASRLYCERCFK